MKLRWTILLCMSIMAQLLFCQARVLTAAADPWPPFVDPASPSEGLTLEIIRAAYRTQGYEIRMYYMPWARAEAGVVAGTYDLLPSTWQTAARHDTLIFSEPYAYNRIKFLKLNTDPFEYNGLESLTGKSIGVIRGYGYDDAFLAARNFTRYEAPDFLSLANMLLAGRIDLTLEDEIVGRVSIANFNPQLLTKLTFTDSALSTKGLHVAIGKRNPRAQELMDAFSRGFALIRSNGEYARIMAKYGIPLD